MEQKKRSDGEKLTLYGFNNLTKNLSFNIYDICYAKSMKEQCEYLAYIDEQYNSERLTKILRDVTEQMGAHVLNISKQDYDPQGASVNMLIADGEVPADMLDPSNNRGNYSENCAGPAMPVEGGMPPGRDIAAHLDKSHVTVHTFPEAHPDKAISTFRVDIDVSTCGMVSPLCSLDYLISAFDSDIITIDYRVRGFTRQKDGRKCFLDHKITSIRDFISEDTLKKYYALDINMYQANLYHSRLMLKEINLSNYLFNLDPDELLPSQRLKIMEAIQEEMIDIYSGQNVYG